MQALREHSQAEYQATLDPFQPEGCNVFVTDLADGGRVTEFLCAKLVVVGVPADNAEHFWLQLYEVGYDRLDRGIHTVRVRSIDNPADDMVVLRTEEWQLELVYPARPAEVWQQWVAYRDNPANAAWIARTDQLALQYPGLGD